MSETAASLLKRLASLSGIKPELEKILRDLIASRGYAPYPPAGVSRFRAQLYRFASFKDYLFEAPPPPGALAFPQADVDCYLPIDVIAYLNLPDHPTNGNVATMFDPAYMNIVGFDTTMQTYDFESWLRFDPILAHTMEGISIIPYSPPDESDPENPIPEVLAQITFPNGHGLQVIPGAVHVRACTAGDMTGVTQGDVEGKYFVLDENTLIARMGSEIGFGDGHSRILLQPIRVVGGGALDPNGESNWLYGQTNIVAEFTGEPRNVFYW